MNLPTDLPSAMQAINNYLMAKGQNIPEFQREKIVEVMGPGTSPFTFMVTVAEALYTVSDELDNDGREAAAIAANLSSVYGWSDMLQRGLAITNAMKRKNGDKNIRQQAKDDPKPKEQFIYKEPEQPLELVPDNGPVSQLDREENDHSPQT